MPPPPSPPSLPILILHPDNVLSPNPSLYRAPLVHRRLQPYDQVDAVASSCDPENVKAKILSGKYGVVLVCDLSQNFQWFTNKFRFCLRSFVNAGGIVAFPTCEGGHLCWYTLRPVFGVEWDRGEYRRRDMIKSSSPLSGEWCPNGPSRMNIKGESLKNVPASQRLYSPSNSSEAIFAVGKYGRGFIAYFSDVNQENPTVEIVLEFLIKARQKAVTFSNPLGEFDVPEPPLKIWSDGWCLEGNQKSKERLAGIGFTFDSLSGFGSYLGPAEDNAHPTKTSLDGASLQAAATALLVAKTHERESVILHSDSQFLRDSVTKMAPMWHNYGWRRQDDGLPPQDLKWHKLLFDLQDSMEVEWRWVVKQQNEKSDRLAQLGTELYLKDPKTPSHISDGVRSTLDKARRLNWRLCPLINRVRVSISGTKRVQVRCAVPMAEDGQLKTVYCLPSLNAYGLVKVKPVFVPNVGRDRLFRLPVTNKAWERFDFQGADSCHLILPPGAVVGVGLIDGNAGDFGDLKFTQVDFLPVEGSTGPLPDSMEEEDDDDNHTFIIDLTEDDDGEFDPEGGDFFAADPVAQAHMMGMFINQIGGMTVDPP